MSKIKEAREKAGITRNELSEHLEIPYRTLQNYETDTRKCPEWVEKLVVAEIERMPKKQVINITRY